MSITIVKDALEYYDKNNELYDKLKQKIRFVKITTKTHNTGIDGLYLTFYDKHKQEMFTSRTEILGKFYNRYNVWIWGWAIPSVDASNVSVIRKVLLYGTNLDVISDINVSSNENMMLLKNELVTSRLKIDDNVQVDIHCAIACYLAKQTLMIEIYDFPMLDSNELTEIFTPHHYIDRPSTTLYLFILNPPSVI